MKYKDIYTFENGICTQVFAKFYPNEFVTIFGNKNSATFVDNLTYYWYSERTFVNCINADNVNNIVRSFIANRMTEWWRMGQDMGLTFDMTKPIQSESERTETVTTNETANKADTSENVAFNETDFTANELNTTTNDVTKSETRTVTNTVSGLGQRSIISEIQRDLELRRTNWRKNIIFEIINAITISIYV